MVELLEEVIREMTSLVLALVLSVTPGQVRLRGEEPAWLDFKESLRKCLGKHRRELVKLLGEPEKIETEPFGRGRGSYRYSSPGIKALAEYGTLGTVQSIGFTPTDKFHAGDLWNCLQDSKTDEPTMVEPDKLKVATYWINDNSFRHSEAGLRGRYFPIELAYEFPKDKVRILIRIETREPPLAGTVRFNPDTNQRELFDTHKNARFNWRDGAVKGFVLSRETSRS